MKPLPFLLISLVLITTACTSVHARDAESEMANSNWRLVSFGNVEAEKQVVEGATITIEFDENDQVGGSSGCNSYGGTYTIKDDNLTIGEIVSTHMACANQAVIDQEKQYLQVLGTAGRYSVTGNNLTIWYNDGRGALTFVRASSPTLASTTPTQTPHSLPTATTETTGERIEFEPDATSATRSGTLSEGDVKSYVLAARDGQTITIDITSDGMPVSLSISSPSGIQLFTEVNQASPTDGGYRAGYSFTLAENGDYIVTLTKADHTPNTNYTVDFTVQ